MACIHGFAPGECLICKTLGPGDSQGATKTRTKSRREARAAASAVPAEVVGRSHPARDDERSGRGSSRMVLHVGVLLVILAVAAVSVFVVADIVFALLHLLEIVAVAVVAGALGYRIGKARGRRER